MRGVQRYRAVLTPPGARRALTWSLVGRVSMAMNGLAVLLVAKQSLSYGQAGVVAAALAVAVSVAAPQRARSADRLGPRRVLLWSAVAHPSAIAVFLVLAQRDVGMGLLTASAAAIGVTMPPLTSVMRALWPLVVERGLLPAAYSLESAAAELCFITGPVAVAGLAATAGAGWALAASGVLASTGSAVLASVPFVRGVVGSPPEAPRRLVGPLVSPVVRTALLTLFLVGVGFGTTEVCVLAFVEERGQPRAVAGVVLGLWSFGSMVGGLLYGAQHSPRRPSRQLPLLVLMEGIGAALPSLAGSTLVLTVLVLVYGSTIAPFFACNALVIGEAAPAGTVTEAFAWASSMVFAGAALGTALAGHVIDVDGAHVALRLGALSGALTVVVTVVGMALSARSRRAQDQLPEGGGERGVVV